MKTKQLLKNVLLTGIVLFFVQSTQAQKNWTAQWITSPQVKNEANTWICFRKEADIPKVPAKMLASLAADSKYWLWINGEMVVFEGGLKRGPSPDDTYYDEFDLAPYLKKGHNTIAVLLWYFGKEGFSHKDSGKAGLLFDCSGSGVSLDSDETWKTLVHPAFSSSDGVQPNWRLSESSLLFDARKDPERWMDKDYDCSSWQSALVLGAPPCQPWNQLVLRPIPQWKNYGLKDYENKSDFPGVSSGEPVIGKLPSNLQITPWLEVETTEGQAIVIRTDHFVGGGEPNVQAKYITKNGKQAYESLGWMNGEEVVYSIPKGVKILGLKYRETGYDSEFAGSFHCSDDFFNQLWNKACRNLYVTMRDNYMDCPDRERAQWWGDEVIESGEAFYAFDCRSHFLQKKGMLELVNWQKPDGTLFSPVPAGNWDKELPGQMLASIGHYGFWNYYLHTGDLQTLADVYDGVLRYLGVWKIKPDGTLVFREGGWNWGDWGEQKDMELLQNAWYYLALTGVHEMATALGKTDDAKRLQHQVDQFKVAFNQQFWNGAAYRHPDYKGQTDDRVQALAVVAGLADEQKYLLLFDVFKTHEHASPYMEKYVIEALFKMGQDVYGLERLKKRFSPMVNDPENSTLWEVWGNETDGFQGGTTNHAWSGGGLTLLSQYVCGIAPIEPGYKKFQVAPQPGALGSASAKVESVQGVIEAAFSNQPESFEMNVTVPENTSALIKLSSGDFTEITSDGKAIWKNGAWVKKNGSKQVSFTAEKGQIEVTGGKWSFKANK
jgi:hypothetical protein